MKERDEGRKERQVRMKEERETPDIWPERQIDLLIQTTGVRDSMDPQIIPVEP